ncbi:MAG: DNA mismatch repair endonuclease MutL [Anaerolineales bacterium]|nr:DNA mismatch repair endonuclease MutL [Anaerolineales bacterium]
MPIKLLTPEVASQIAAGEVIERPASVVKELVENALDAAAASIVVTIQEAGRTLIEVADDGEGIRSTELPLAVSRHATSKLLHAADLFHISTLGFRGEALSSIGSVSRLTITSRHAEEQNGVTLQVEGGNIGKSKPIGIPVGTVVRVENLFYNVPARLKFLKTDTTEKRTIDDLLTRYAMAYPKVRFKLTDGHKVFLQTAGDNDQRAILATLYGIDIGKQMLEVLAEEDMLKLTGFISPLAVTRSNRREITFFINGRWVQDVALRTALIQAYHTMLMVGRYPIAALFLEMDPEDVDVNVHPAKAEVRFRGQDRIFSFVQRAARRALLAYSPVPSLPSRQFWGGHSPQENLDWSLDRETDLLPKQEAAIPDTTQAITTPAQSSISNIPLLRLIGQIGAAYLVAEGPDGLYLIDQHAAHERVLFEKLLAQFEMKNIPSQALLSPIAVQVSPGQSTLLEEQLPVLQTFGFEIETFGPNTFQVRSMPALFGGANPETALRALVEDFEEDETPLQEEIETRIAGRVCKRLAVKAGQTLTHEEQSALLTDLENCDSPRTCPHGRPTMIHLSVDMLERQFGRRGAR